MNHVEKAFYASFSCYNNINSYLPVRGQYVMHGITSASAGVALIALAYLGPLYRLVTNGEANFSSDPIHEFSPIKGALLTLSIVCFLGTTYCFKIAISKDLGKVYSSKTCPQSALRANL